MNQLNNLLSFIQQSQGIDNELSLSPLKVAANTLAKEQRKNPNSKSNASSAEVGTVKFTKKELSTMPQTFQQFFSVDGRIVKYRYYEGLFQARYRRDGYNIEVASKDFDIMKQKFIFKLNSETDNLPAQPKSGKSDVLFSTYGWAWLDVKKQTTKPSTYKEYERSFKVNLEPTFGHLKLSQISRQMVQEYLFNFVREEKHRTAEKLKLQLTCIFDMAYEDFGLPSPMRKIVLPYRETKKGVALTKVEERELVNYCQNRKDDVAGALLILLYFGLRQSELASIHIIDDKFLQCETSKGRLGREPMYRKIPFTPVAKCVISMIDFQAAKAINLNKLKSAFKRLFPNHHAHELRYTFITRCKECHVNPELVMLWDGHKSDSDVRTSKVDRGYTDYSEEYILSEAEKVDYTF